MTADKRRFRRLEIRIPAEIAAVEAEVLPLDTTIVNLGPDGVLCEAAACLPQGTLVRVLFDLTDPPDLVDVVGVDAVGEIRWVTEQGKKKGMGVQFTRISKDEKDAIYRFILLKLAEARGMT